MASKTEIILQQTPVLTPNQLWEQYNAMCDIVVDKDVIWKFQEEMQKTMGLIVSQFGANLEVGDYSNAKVLIGQARSVMQLSTLVWSGVAAEIGAKNGIFLDF